MKDSGHVPRVRPCRALSLWLLICAGLWLRVAPSQAAHMWTDFKLLLSLVREMGKISYLLGLP